jgi:REase_AHJR-like
VTETTSEAAILRAVLPELEAEGYEVFLQPNEVLLPEFFLGYRPDAVALSPKKNLAIEIARESPASRSKLQKLSSLLKDQPNWELRVFWVSPHNAKPDLSIQLTENVKASLREAQELWSGGHYGSSLLIGWATFEAICRILMPKAFARPQTPGRLIEVLANEGYATPDESDRLRPLAQLRNSFIHGSLDVRMDKNEIDFFLQFLAKLEKEMKAH